MFELSLKPKLVLGFRINFTKVARFIMIFITLIYLLHRLCQRFSEDSDTAGITTKIFLHRLYHRKSISSAGVSNVMKLNSPFVYKGEL